MMVMRRMLFMIGASAALIAQPLRAAEAAPVVQPISLDAFLELKNPNLCLFGDEFQTFRNGIFKRKPGSEAPLPGIIQIPENIDAAFAGPEYQEQEDRSLVFVIPVAATWGNLPVRAFVANAPATGKIPKFFFIIGASYAAAKNMLAGKGMILNEAGELTTAGEVYSVAIMLKPVPEIDDHMILECTWR
jgi:hypothetical protein